MSSILGDRHASLASALQSGPRSASGLASRSAARCMASAAASKATAASASASLDTAEPIDPPKKRRGRPRGSTNAKAATTEAKADCATPSRQRGRPRKDEPGSADVSATLDDEAHNLPPPDIPDAFGDAHVPPVTDPVGGRGATIRPATVLERFPHLAVLPGAESIVEAEAGPSLRPDGSVNTNVPSVTKVTYDDERFCGPAGARVHLWWDIEQRTGAWFDVRNSCAITGSEIAAAAGENVFKSPLELWKEKLGKAKKFRGNEATDWGTFHEATALEMYGSVSGNKAMDVGFAKREGYEWMGCSPDLMVVTDVSRHIAADGDGTALRPPSVWGVGEAKCPYYKRQVHEAIPYYYRAQIHAEMFCTGAQWCDYFSHVPASRSLPPQINIIRVVFNWEYFQAILDRLEYFRDCVAEGRPPDRLSYDPLTHL